uniref:NADP-dependent oxidoreductase domain-containing protein n=1 Tax=Setaria digitata TaxID=48799 RepID=A0A915PIJ1_9BILA
MALTNCVGGTAKLNSGFSIPMVGLGTYKIVGQDTVTAAVDAALKAGYRLFDTAKYYLNERELGIALRELLPKYNLKREEIFITTKFFLSEINNDVHTRKMVDESLTNLQTEYLDLVLIHYPKPDTSKNDDPRNPESRKIAYLELEKLKDENKIRSVGVSNYEVKHIKEIQSFGRMMPSVNQVEFHPHFTRNELREYCKSMGIFFQAYSSLARNHPDLMGDSMIVKTAETHNSAPQLIVLAWALSLGVGVIPKSSNPERVINNFKAWPFECLT